MTYASLESQFIIAGRAHNTIDPRKLISMPQDAIQHVLGGAPRLTLTKYFRDRCSRAVSRIVSQWLHLNNLT